MRLLFATLMLMTITASAKETKETVVKERDGSTTHIITDRLGTEVYVDDKWVYSAGGDRHKEQVDYSLNKGGKVVKNQ
jgi:hypothetical protein